MSQLQYSILFLLLVFLGGLFGHLGMSAFVISCIVAGVFIAIVMFVKQCDKGCSDDD